MPGAESGPATPPRLSLDPPIFPLALIEGTTTISSTASPLLAGFALTILLLVLPTAANDGPTSSFMRWPELVVLLLTGSAALLVNAVQAGAHARSRHVTPDEARMWLQDQMAAAAIINFRNVMQAEARKWINRTRWLYQGGILLLLVAITLVLVPPEGVALSFWRAASIGVAGFAVVVECCWIARKAAEISCARGA